MHHTKQSPGQLNIHGGTKNKHEEKKKKRERKKAGMQVKENVVSQLDVNLRRVGLGLGAGGRRGGRETRVRTTRRKKRTDCLEGEGEIKDPKSGQDGPVSAIGKGNEAKEHTPNGGFVQPKIKMWRARCPPAHSDTQASLGGGDQDNPET